MPRVAFARFAVQLGLALQPTVASNVLQFDAAPDQHATNQQIAVAFRRVFFAAQQGYTILLDTFFQPFDAFQKRRRRGQSIVQDEAIGVIELRVVRPAAHLLAQEDVTDTGRGQGGFDLIGVELRRVLRVGLRAHVGHYVDLVLLQQLDECLFVVVGVPNREHAMFFRRGLLGHTQVTPSGSFCRRSKH